MPSFLKLITTLTLKIKKNDKKNIEYINYGNPKVTPQDTQKTGTMTQAKYLEIAGRIEDYMIRNQKAPPFSSYSPLGKYFGYENLIYTYSKILDNYNTNGQLPASIKIVPWNYVKSYAGKFTIQQTKTAANYLKTYVESNKKLPSSVPITGTDLNGQITNTHITLPAFLKLLTTTTLKIKNNDNTPTTLFNTYKNPTTTPQDTQKTGTMTQAKYIEIAGRIEDYMIRNQKAPPYSSYSPLGKYFGYENLIYTYSKILDAYNPTLPTKTTVSSWKDLKNYLGSFTIQQTTQAAADVKKYIEKYKKLPSSVTINKINVNMPAFLKLLTTTTLKIKKNDNTPTTLFNTYKNPTTTPQDTQKTGTMTQAKYIEIAGRIEDYMIRNQKAPPFSSYSPLGKYFGYENLIYTYSKILDNYQNSAKLPSSTKIYSWDMITHFEGTFTIQQTTQAATKVKEYIEKYNKLPGSVAITGTDLNGQIINTHITLPAFLELLTTITLKINNNDNRPTQLMNYYKNPSAPKEEIHSGSMSLARYVDIAGRVKDYMDRNHNAPNFSSYSNLGKYFGYENLIYTYSKILDNYQNSAKLPSSLVIKPWHKFSRDQVADAATSVKNYVNNNHKLPNYVTINGVQVAIPSFLQILTRTVLNIENGVNEPVYYEYCDPASAPRDSQSSGDVSIVSYLVVAEKVNAYMNTNWAAPNYSSYSPLGTYFGYHNLVYTFSKVLSYFDSNNALPSTVGVKNWIYVILPQLENIPSSLVLYTQPTANCQSTHSAIVSLAYQLASGGNSVWDVGNNIFEWVRDNLGYSFYYNTKYGAVGTLDKRSGNCVDTAHLVVALSRAIGIPARYVHGDCYFKYSKTWYGHVFAQLYINGKWYNADGTSYSNTLGNIVNWDTSSFKYKATYRELPF